MGLDKSIDPTVSVYKKYLVCTSPLLIACDSPQWCWLVLPGSRWNLLTSEVLLLRRIGRLLTALSRLHRTVQAVHRAGQAFNVPGQPSHYCATFPLFVFSKTVWRKGRYSSSRFFISYLVQATWHEYVVCKSTKILKQFVPNWEIQ